MFQYNDIEDEVSEYLQPFFDELAAVITLPDNQKAFKRGIEKGLVVVAYAGSDFDPPAVSDMVHQVENIVVLINVASSSLRGETGVYNLIEILKRNLLGYRPQNTTGRIYLRSIQFDDRDEDNSLFKYNVEFACRKPQVQEISDEQSDGTALRTVVVRTQM